MTAAITFAPWALRTAVRFFICQSKCKKFQICIEIRNNKCYTVYANIKNIQRYI